MLINRLHPVFRPYMAPATSAEDFTPTAGDRGDDFTPTEDADDAGADDNKGNKAGAGGDEGDDKPSKKAEKAGKTAGDADEDADADDADDADKKDRKAQKRIPLARHEELLKKERARRDELEERLKQYEKGEKVATVNEQLTAIETQITDAEAKLEKAEEALAKLLTDGETDKAVAKQREIRQLNNVIRKLDREQSGLVNDHKLAVATAQATEAARYNVALERVEEAYPQLNPDHSEFDSELMGDVVDLMQAYQAKGMTATAALQKAVKRMVPQPETKKQKEAVDVSPRPTAEDVAAARKKAAVEKAVETKAKSPADLKNVGLDSDKAGGGALKAKDIAKLSLKEFAKIADEDLARARGDYL